MLRGGGRRWEGLGAPAPLSPQELFIANSQKYAQETELSQHVRRWEERIGPLLQEQAGTHAGRGLGWAGDRQPPPSA